MHKWDRISWVATGIFVTSVALATIFQKDIYLFLMVGSYMLRPTLYALGIASRFADERQISIQYRSGNLALTILIAAIIVMAIKNQIEGKPPDDFNVLLMVGLASRALSGVLMIGDYRAVGMRIAIAVGSLWILFVLAENGLALGAVPEAGPGIVFVLLGLLGGRMPRISAWILAVLAVAAIYFIAFRTGHGFTFYQALTGLLVSLPLAAASFCFFKSAQTETEVPVP
jgi:hypothetical protein